MNVYHFYPYWNGAGRVLQNLAVKLLREGTARRQKEEAQEKLRL